MKKIILLLLLFSAGNLVFSEKYYDHFPQNLEEELSDDMGIIPEGWGPNGLFAYSEGFGNPWIPSHGTRYVIYSLVADKVLWETSYQIMPGMDQDEEKAKTDAESAFLREMNSQNIKKAETSLQNFSDHSQKTLKIYLEIDEATATDAYCTTSYDYYYEIYAEKDGRQKKISSGSTYMAIYKHIVGYLKHPDEDRIAVIIKTYNAGLECEHSMSTQIIGCHTKIGLE